MKTKDLLKQAREKGFKEGLIFISATGVADSLVQGELKIKNFTPKNPTFPTKEEIKEMEHNGDIVSTLGYGVIYDSSTETWGQPTDLMAFNTSKTGTNFKKLLMIDMDDYS
jgi:hypothetical protein